MTGSDLAFNVAFKQAGIIRVETAEELFDIAEIFSTQSIPVGPNLLIVTNAGGPGILAADSCEKYGLNMAPISLEISEKLRKELPPESGFYNPIDVLGDADSDRYRFALETAIVSPDVHSVLTILTPQAMTEPEDTAEVLKKIKEKFPEKPILLAFLGGMAVEKASSILKDGGIANYPFPERAVKSLQTLVKYGEFLKTSHKRILQKFDVGYNKASNIFNKVIKSDRVTLTASEATEVLRAYGISAPLISLATTAEEAASIADSVGYPVAMKVESPQILHKTDLGGVRLNLGSAEEVRRSFYEIIGRAHVFAPNAIISGVNVHRMVPQGREMIIGVHRDITFGPLIMFGLGGIYVNFLRDVAFRLAPLSRESAYNMIMETKAYTLLRGIRGEKASDIDSVINTILRISQLVTDFKIINEMDINPLFVYESGKGCIALDVKITIGS